MRLIDDDQTNVVEMQFLVVDPVFQGFDHRHKT